MIRKVVKPQYTNLTIDIPTSFIDKEIEIIISPIDKKDTAEKGIKKSLREIC